MDNSLCPNAGLPSSIQTTTKHLQQHWMTFVTSLSPFIEKQLYLKWLKSQIRKRHVRSLSFGSISHLALCSLPDRVQNLFIRSKPVRGAPEILLFWSCNAVTAIFVSFRFQNQLYFLSIVQMWSQVENGRCWSSQHRQTRQVERSSSHFQRAQVWRPYCFQLWFFVWFSDKLTFSEWLPKGRLSKPEHKSL